MTWTKPGTISVAGLLSALSLLAIAGCDGGSGSAEPDRDQQEAFAETVGVDAIMDLEAAPDVIPDTPPERVDAGDDAEVVSTDLPVDSEVQGACDEDGDCPPSVAIEAPEPGAVVHGPVEVKVAAGDDDAVVKVRFIVDGGLLAEDAQVPYKVIWETAEFDDGPHALEVIAFDTAGQTASAEIQVTTDNTPPEIALLSPEEGAIQHDQILLAVEASDALQMDRVEFTVDGGDPEAVTEEPWELEYDGSNLISGLHEVVATAFDAAGNEASVPREFLLDRPPAVALLAPEGGATVAGPIQVQAEAADDLGLTAVALFVDGLWAAELLPADGGLYEILWTPAYEKGERLLSVTAADSVGQETSAAVTVLVDHPIIVGLQICADEVCDALDTDAELTGTMQVRAVAADDGAAIVGVDFLVDGIPAHQDLEAPFDFLWDTAGVADGARLLEAVATNALDETGEVQVQVQVNNCDLDHDEYTALGCGGPDCDDGAPGLNPGAVDAAGNGLDENCDGLDGVDEDGDGYASEASGGDDCDDGLPQAHPCADDLPGDGVDANCDGADELSCDDCVSCTVDGLVAGACVHAPVPDGLPCDDGDPCTAPGTCQGGLCQVGPVVDCDDTNPCTADGCTPESGCWHLPLDGVPCYDDGICAGGECATGPCPPGYADLNGEIGDGCEYQCPTDPDFVDLPDPEGLDLDCDGIDGEQDAAIFVSPLGVDLWNTSGSVGNPVATLDKGIELALLQDPPFAVYVAAGDYEEQLVLADGVSLYGGYDPDSWVRDPETWISRVHWSTPGLGGIIAVVAQDIVSETMVAGLTFDAAPNPAPSGNSIAVAVMNCSDQLAFFNNTVIAGGGGDGLGGLPGADGEPGEPGFDGMVGCEYGGNWCAIACSSCDHPSAGMGGEGSCSNSGGSGGKGGFSGGSGQAGTAAEDGSSGGNGGGKMNNGGPGFDGGHGANGGEGSGGDGFGSFNEAGFWTPSFGTAGTAGTGGKGGGGGGGGGGDDNSACYCYSYGASGGGGGGGGCPGT
ncbi:MAG: Ig-like domain-containing protein, partial [Pseudomonadota bacterium]